MITVRQRFHEEIARAKAELLARILWRGKDRRRIKREERKAGDAAVKEWRRTH